MKYQIGNSKINYQIRSKFKIYIYNIIYIDQLANVLFKNQYYNILYIKINIEFKINLYQS